MEKEIEKVSRMKKYCCITELVTHMNDTARAAFEGTKYQETYLLYHDALTSMCDKDCRKWMEEQGILKHWILPELGLNNEVITENAEGEILKSKRYAGRPVGDCAEAMPLDNSLFRDLRTSLDIHVMLTSLLEKDDPRRFSKGTPKKIVQSISRLWWQENGVSPKPDRIIQDINRLQENLRTVYDADGAVVIGVVDRNGHRKRNGVGRQFWPRKENQIALSIEQLGLHPDCQQAVHEVHEKEWAAYQQSKANQN